MEQKHELPKGGSELSYLQFPYPEKIINNHAIGICIGAATISVVKVKCDATGRIRILKVINLVSNGNPKQTLLSALSQIPEATPAVVTGRNFRKRVDLTSISESEATESALQLFTRDDHQYAAVASLGAETFVVYELNKEGKIRKLISKNQCASGTGEFFMQQTGRMNLEVSEAVKISAGSSPYRVSGRCSVFCKSDCTHALNKGIPKNEVSAGLALMIAEKAEELLKRSRRGKFMLIGGVTRNTTVINFLREKFEDLFIPEQAQYIEALGAAVYALNHKVTIYHQQNVIVESDSLFTFNKPLSEYQDMVNFRKAEMAQPEENDECILGLDIGSTTTKGVLIRTIDNSIIASEYIYTHGNPVKASVEVYQSLLNQINVAIRIIGLGVTGSGRHITALHSGTKSIINEITAHAKAAVYFDPGVDTIFEIGGQDAKYTYINNGVPADYAMNEACSAGTGSFIQEAAWESLKVSLYDIETAAFNSVKPLNFRDQCAALIGSDIKSALQENYSQEDILAGLVYSICFNYINRVKGKRPVGNKIFMQGGVCYNKAIPAAMAAITGKAIIVPPFPGLMGAFGTALKVKEDIESGLVKKHSFILQDLISREFTSEKSFICNDKTNGCDRKCEIYTFRINGKIAPFGGACNKYYDAFTHTERNWQKNDFVTLRMQKVFDRDTLLPEDQSTIGINQTFTVNRLYPLYHSFFSLLGFRIILSDAVDKNGFDNQHSSFCYPVELSHGLFSNLISKNPDYIFMPEVYEMHVEGCENDQKDSTATCVFISKEINYLSQAFKFDESRIIHPYLNFAKGYLSQESEFIKIARQIGVNSRGNAVKAFRQAVTIQRNVESELYDMGNDVIAQLKENPEEIAIVIVGRDYNAFSAFANKGIPQKFASLGYKVIPYDILDSTDEEIVSYQSWEAGKRILRVAQTILKNEQLFPVYISNFSCGPDSFLVPIFRKVLVDKPSLTLELDQHTADAGINTRIDAFLDVIKNRRRLPTTKTSDEFSGYRPAEIVYLNSTAVYIDSAGNKLDLKDDRVTIIVPSIGDMVAALFAASLRSLGYNAVALPEMEPEILEKGLKHTSGKECLPIILLSGSLINYIDKNKLNGHRLAFMNIGGTSACRVAQYPVFLSNLVKSENIKNVAMLTLISQEGYLGLSKGFLKRSMDAIILNDILEDVRAGILSNATDSDKGLEIFYDEFYKLVDVFSDNYNDLYPALENFSNNIRMLVPSKIPVSESKYIALTGEIFIRHNQFAHKKLNHYFGKHGFILKDAYISEWVKYLDYSWRKGVDKPSFSFSDIVNRLIRGQYITYIEGRMQRILECSGYLKRHKTRIVNTIRHSLHILPLESTGEPALTLGTALSEGYEQYCGIINIGPFGCLQTRIGEAICTPNMTLGKKKTVKDNLNISYKIPSNLNEETDIPFITIECDGKGYPQIIESKLETFLIQAERAAIAMKNNHRVEALRK